MDRTFRGGEAWKEKCCDSDPKRSAKSFEMVASTLGMVIRDLRTRSAYRSEIRRFVMTSMLDGFGLLNWLARLA